MNLLKKLTGAKPKQGHSLQSGDGSGSADRGYVPPSAGQEIQDRERLAEAAEQRLVKKQGKRKDPEVVKKEHWDKYEAIGNTSTSITTSTAPVSPPSASNGAGHMLGSGGGGGPGGGATAPRQNGPAGASRLLVSDSEKAKDKKEKKKQESWESYAGIQQPTKTRPAGESSNAPDRKPSPSGGGVNIESALVVLLEVNPLDRALESLQLLEKVLGNIVAHPGEDKYRRLKLENPKIDEKIVQVSGAVEILLAAGFRHEDAFLVYSQPETDPLEAVLGLLSSRLRELSSTQ